MNLSFMFQRDFMEYHQNRFHDHSILGYYKDQLSALIPAHQVDNKIISHGGLSYGGIYFRDNLKFLNQNEAFTELELYLRASNIEIIDIKLDPYAILSQRNNTAIENWLLQSPLESSVQVNQILMKNALKPNERKRRNINKAHKLNIQFVKSEEYHHYWNTLLIPTLNERHGTSPVHTVEEISKLASLFKSKISLWLVKSSEGQTIAGAVTFDHGFVLHFQYFASNSLGRDCGALDFLVIKVCEQTTCPYISLGTSSEKMGINESLFQWKTEFGAFPLSHIRASKNIKFNLKS